MHIHQSLKGIVIAQDSECPSLMVKPTFCGQARKVGNVPQNDIAHASGCLRVHMKDRCLHSGGKATLKSARSCRDTDRPRLVGTIPAIHTLAPKTTIIVEVRTRALHCTADIETVVGNPPNRHREVASPLQHRPAARCPWMEIARALAPAAWTSHLGPIYLRNR